MAGVPVETAYGILAACLTLLRSAVTLTQCEPPASPFILAAPDFSADEVVIHAGSLLKDFAHQLALPILCYAQSHGIGLLASAHVEALEGRGLTGRVNGKICVLGKHSLMAQAGIDCQSLEEEARTLLESGHDIYFLSIGDHLAGLIALLEDHKP